MVFNAGHDAHMKLLQQEASGEELPFRIILLHAEDQLMSAEASVSFAERFITVYQRMGCKRLTDYLTGSRGLPCSPSSRFMKMFSRSRRYPMAFPEALLDQG